MLSSYISGGTPTYFTILYQQLQLKYNNMLQLLAEKNNQEKIREVQFNTLLAELKNMESELLQAKQELNEMTKQRDAVSKNFLWNFG